jgi:hypothetical protein
MPTGGRALDDAPFRINVRAAPAARTRRRPQRRATVGRNHTNYVGLRSVERVEGRMTAGRAALVGAAWGIIVEALLALLAGIFPWDSGSAEMLAYAVVIGAVFGAVSGALFSRQCLPAELAKRGRLWRSVLLEDQGISLPLAFTLHERRIGRTGVVFTSARHA